MSDNLRDVEEENILSLIFIYLVIRSICWLVLYIAREVLIYQIAGAGDRVDREYVSHAAFESLVVLLSCHYYASSQVFLIVLKRIPN